MNQQKIPVNIKALGLRGTTLKNTEHALGIVIYTGHSTKIMKNAKNPPSKMSGVLKKMNQILYSVRHPRI
jgi:Cation transport ATPase